MELEAAHGPGTRAAHTDSIFGSLTSLALLTRLNAVRLGHISAASFQALIVTLLRSNPAAWRASELIRTLCSTVLLCGVPLSSRRTLFFYSQSSFSYFSSFLSANPAGPASSTAYRRVTASKETVLLMFAGRFFQLHQLTSLLVSQQKPEVKKK